MIHDVSLPFKRNGQYLFRIPYGQDRQAYLYAADHDEAVKLTAGLPGCRIPDIAAVHYNYKELATDAFGDKHEDSPEMMKEELDDLSCNFWLLTSKVRRMESDINGDVDNLLTLPSLVGLVLSLCSITYLSSQGDTSSLSFSCAGIGLVVSVVVLMTCYTQCICERINRKAGMSVQQPPK